MCTLHKEWQCAAGIKLRRRLVMQCAVRAVFIVIPALYGNPDACFSQIRELVIVKVFIPELTVKPFDERILGRLARVN